MNEGANRDTAGHSGLRTWVAGRLNREEGIPETLWDILGCQGHVSKVREGEMSVSQLVEYARLLLQYVDIVESARDGSSQGVPRKLPKEEAVLDGREERRADALLEYILFAATVHPVTRCYREWVRSLDGERVQEQRLLFRAMEQDSKSSYKRAQENRHEDECSLKLVEAAEAIAGDFGGYWSEHEAARFLLGHGVTKHSPMQAWIEESSGHLLSYSTINLRIEPWMPVEIVSKFYQYHQLHLLGRKSRAISESKLSLVSFVLARLREWWSQGMQGTSDEQPEARLKNFSWKELQQLWNDSGEAEKLDERYKDERRFNNDFYRTVRSLIAPFAPRQDK